MMMILCGMTGLCIAQPASTQQAASQHDALGGPHPIALTDRKTADQLIVVPNNGAAGETSTNATAESAYPYGISLQMVVSWRKGHLDELDQGISNDVAQLLKLPLKSPERKALADSIRAKRVERAAIQRMKDVDIAARITSDRVAAEQRRREAVQAKAQREAEEAAVRSRKFPNWDGPWKVCPICRGTGRDADAEREVNTRNSGIIGGQIAGTGGSARIKGAVIECEVCGGNGDVPDGR